jgi:ATP-dependent DNA helicase DinG
MGFDYADLDAYQVGSPLPSWVTALRDHQVTAVSDIVEAQRDGADVVFLDAPTGSGKTLIGVLAQRARAVQGIGGPRAVYVASDKQLQRQFIRDFPEAALLMGRANYPTELRPGLTANDCTRTGESNCRWCDSTATCPYQIAKNEALGARLAILNTHYLLSAANHVGTFTGEDFVIADEADTLESVLLSYAQFDVPEWAMQLTGMVAPKKGSHKPTLVRYITDIGEAVRSEIPHSTSAKEQRARAAFAANCRLAARSIQRDIDAGTEDEDTGRWLRTYDTGDDGLTLVPVLVAPFGAAHLWRHARNWLCMSATLVSVDEMVDTLGLPLDHATVTVPMTFPVENRPIIMAPVANMTAKADDSEYARMAWAIDVAAREHPHDRILVHTVSRARAERLIAICRREKYLDRRRIVDYRGPRERDLALQTYLKHESSVLFAHSMSRGVDLPGDACRVQVIAKAPFPNLGDRRTAARLHLPGGELWYAVQAVRDVVQMTGRAVRSNTDQATTYIFDAQFASNLWKPGRRNLFPAWWREAVDTRRDVRPFMHPA